MTSRGKLLGFVAQSAAAGLAVAFAVVLIRPDLVSLGTGARTHATSDASAVNASAPAVVS